MIDDYKIDIGWEKTCNCKPNHINCLSAKEWMKAQVALWEFSYNGLDIRDKKVHPAVFPIGLPKKAIELFTHKGELVIDPFVGSGTTLIAAQELERNAVGFDLKNEYVNLSNSRLKQTKLNSDTKQIAIHDNALNISKYLDEGTVSLAVTSPPYANMLNRKRKNKSMRGDLRENEHYDTVQQYSNDPQDLGTMKVEEYSTQIEKIYAGILPLLKPKAHSVINITDLWWEGHRIPLHIEMIDAMKRAGYELRNTIIWDRRNIVNRAGIFGYPSNYITLGTTFEYILDFWKPPKA